MKCSKLETNYRFVLQKPVIERKKRRILRRKPKRTDYSLLTSEETEAKQITAPAGNK